MMVISWSCQVRAKLMEALGKDDFEEVAGAWRSLAQLAQLRFFGCQVKVRPEMGCGTDAEDGMKRASFCQKSWEMVWEIDP